MERINEQFNLKSILLGCELVFLGISGLTLVALFGWISGFAM